MKRTSLWETRDSIAGTMTAVMASWWVILLESGERSVFEFEEKAW